MIRSAVQFGLVLGSLAAGGIALFLLQYLSGHRGKPGTVWFMGNITSVAIFCLAYGVGLLVFDPLLRTVLESLTFVTLAFMGPFFMVFGLEYTGRTEPLRSPLGVIVAGVPLVTTVLVATNPVHGLVWQGLRLDPVFGAATVRYALQPWGVFAVLFSVATAAVGSLAIIEAILNYGQLYRREATAVVLSTVPVSAGVLLWLFEVGPAPQLHLTSVLMLGHLALDSYAFVGTHMFETSPATQRAAERSALDDLNEPLLVLDTAGQVVNLNESAARLFEFPEEPTFPVTVERLTGVGREELVAAGELAVDRSLFAVSETPLTDQRGNAVGEMLVLYDVTTQRQRERQLSVLNRVLRHNLRNEMTVVRGRAEAIKDDLDDDPVSQADSIVRASDRILSIVENIRDSERVLQAGSDPIEVDVRTLAEEVRETVLERYPEAQIDIESTTDRPRIVIDRPVLELAVQNTVENAVVHAEQSSPTVTVRLEGSDDRVRLLVEDHNERIPELELSSLQAGQDQPLQHGRGLGLWTIDRCISALGGELMFQYDDGNTVVLELPR